MNPFVSLYKSMVKKPKLGTNIDDIIERVKIMRKTTNINEYLQLHTSINHRDTCILHTEYVKIFNLITSKIIGFDVQIDKLLFPIEEYEYEILKPISSIIKGVVIDGSISAIEKHLESQIRWNPQLAADNQDRQQYMKTNLNINLDKPNNLPDFPSFEFIDFFINETAYAFDMMKRDKKTGLFIIDTRFMSKYEHKPGFMKCGLCKAYFKLTKQQGFKLQYFKYNDTAYYRNNTKNAFIPLYSLYFDMLTYITVCVHAIQTHYLVSANLMDKNTRYLPLEHPIRQLLLPTELNCMTGYIGGQFVLFLKGSLFYNAFCYTDKGLTEMENDYIANHRYDLFTNDTLFTKLHLFTEEMEYYPINTYNVYYKMINRLTDSFVEECSSQGLMNDEVNTWLNMCYPNEDRPYGTSVKTIMKSIVRNMFFNSIQHKMINNKNFVYTFMNYPALQLNETTEEYYIDLNILNTTSILIIKADADLIPMTKNMSFLITNKRLKRLVDTFHLEIKDLDDSYPSGFIQCLKPSGISYSVGI